MEQWIKDCERLDFINVDVCFCINEDFYYGPHDVISIEERKQTMPLPSVTNKAAATFNFRSLKAEDNTEKLLAYYKEVLRLAANYKRAPLEISHYFWLKLYFWRPDVGITMNFPWYDTLDEIAPVLEKIASGENGLLLKDFDQGWDIEIHGDDDYIYAREGDLSEGEINILHKIPRAPLAMECREVLERTRALIAWLSDNVGKDYWTSPSFPADLMQK